MDGKHAQVEVNGNDITIRHQDYQGGKVAYPIKNSFNYQRCVINYPEIKGLSSWREIVDEKLKKRLSSFVNEEAKFNYVKSEFESQGFKYIAHQKKGFRVKKDGKF